MADDFYLHVNATFSRRIYYM